MEVLLYLLLSLVGAIWILYRGEHRQKALQAPEDPPPPALDLAHTLVKRRR